MISAKHKFWENILEGSQNFSDTSPPPQLTRVTAVLHWAIEVCLMNKSSHLHNDAHMPYISHNFPIATGETWGPFY